MILIDRVTKIYDKGTQRSLDGVTLHIKPGEFVILIGASGAGKSTLLKLLTREIFQTSGKIVIGGLDYDDIMSSEVPALRRRIGTVFQDFKLLPNRTVYENIAFALEISGASNKEIQAIVPRMIELVGLSGRRDQFPDQLSGGEQQRVAIARAMVRNPKILIADEPTGNLDSKNSAEVIALLEKINQHGTTVMLVTHDVNIVKALEKRVITLEHGKVTSDTMRKGAV
ncbi:MAG: cell division ATP-binding protein FtsE [Candidatus Nomurabacteria bacterium]|jgi:cell division transport system ATP-binding protein|nr:cell division ATP-binding protein FtsE [Candidatus Nomurabacteria bacterium]